MWFWYGLISALLSAISVTVNKKILKKVHARLLSWSLFTLPIPFLVLLVVKEGRISLNSNFFYAALASGISFAIAKTITLDSIKKGTLSKIYPLVALGPIFTYIFGTLFLSEQITTPALLGLLCVVLGLYILNIEQAHEGWFKPIKFLFIDKTTTLFIFGIILGSLTTIFDKIALLNTNPNSPTLTLLIEYIIMSVLLMSYLTHKDKSWLKELKINLPGLFFASFIYTILALIIFLGFISGPVALFHGVKKLEVIFVLLIGYLFFNEKPAKGSWLAASIMILGVVLIRLG